MKKYKYILLSIILFIFIKNIDIVISSSSEASILFFDKIFVSIFPFIILIDVLLFFNYQEFLKKIFGKILSKIFNIDENISIIFILSILTGTPTNSIYIKEMLDNNQIDINTANKILLFSYFQSIPFVIGTIGVKLYNSLKIGIIIWIFILLNNILIGLYTRNYNATIKQIIYKKKNKISLLNTIKESILKGINTSYDIIGNLIIFTIIINLIKKYIIINPIILSILSGLLEITNGVNQIYLLNLDLTIKISLTIFILSFSGLSIIFQTFSILSNYKIDIKRILITRLVFSIITTILFIIINYCFKLIILSYSTKKVFIII
jgi:sporulation integral membrane protein YlbJ